MSKTLTPYETESLSLFLDQLEAVTALARSAGFDRELIIETADACPHGRFRASVLTVALLGRIGRLALKEADK